MKSNVETVLDAIRTTRSYDGLSVLGCIFAPLLIWTVASGDLALEPPGPWRIPGDSEMAPLINLLVWALTLLGFGVMTAGATGFGVGGVWRLIDRTPAIRADGAGVHFHPSLYPGVAPWKIVSSICLTDDSPREIEIRLTERFWSTSAWATGRKVHLNLIALGLGEDEAERWVEAQQRWLHSRGKTASRLGKRLQ